LPIIYEPPSVTPGYPASGYPIFPAIDPTRLTGFNWGMFKASPSFKTLVQTPANNRGELRVALTQYPIWMFDFPFPVIMGDPETVNYGYQQLIGFYGQMQGQAGAFLFDWPGNDTVALQQIAVGNGSTLVFPMYVAIGGMIELIQNFIGAPLIYVGGVLQSGGYAIDQYGNLSFGEPPGSGFAIQWSGSYYRLCRFLADELQELQLVRGRGGALQSLWQLKSLKFKSLLL
jgi:Conserved hypothetical protein 2217 (DUF2460)